MLRSAEFFKDETLQGISRAIKHLHQMQAEAFTQKMENFGITKNNPHLRSLLNHLDMALCLGLEEPHKGYWPLMKKICHKATIQMVESHEHGTDNAKRGQIWLFLAFIESSLVSYLQVLKESKKLLKWFYKKYALLRDQERFEILQQLVVGLEMVNFVLDFNSPFLNYGREPIFKPSDFYSKKTSASSIENNHLPNAYNGSAFSAPTAPTPDVANSALMRAASVGATPDLLCNTGSRQDGGRRLSKADLDGLEDDGLVTHLKTKKRNGSSRRRKPNSVSRSESISNQLEEDNYIPEFQDSWPITVVVPDTIEILEGTAERVTSDASLVDETVYQDFLMNFQKSPNANETRTIGDQLEGLSLNQEIDVIQSESNSTDPRIFSPEPDPFDSDCTDGQGQNYGHKNYLRDRNERFLFTDDPVKPEEDQRDFNDENGELHVGDEPGNDLEDPDGFNTDFISSSLHSEGAYRITYVSDDDDEQDVQQDRAKYRSMSLDSFDRFCRSGSVGPEQRKKRSDDGNDDDDDQEEEEEKELKLCLDSAIESSESHEANTPSRDILLDSNAITSSPMSERLSKASVDKVLNARFDTTTGILLPTLPRRPDLSNACEMHQDLSLEQNVLLLISLEIFEKSTETFKKLFDVYIGCLFGARKLVSLLITNENIYLLTREEKQERGYVKEMSLPLDSINRIQTGLNMQDILICHDGGKVRLWTGDEISTKNIIMALSSQLKSGNARSVSVEQMKVDTHDNFELIIKEWLLYLENLQEAEILHFALVDFHSITTQEPERQVLKSGYLQRKQSYLGMVPYWEQCIFGLRGSSLYEYSGKGNNELKNVYDLGKCGGVVRMKVADKAHALKVLSKDGSTPLLELAAASEDEANDWIVNICQVVADSKHGKNQYLTPLKDGVSPRGLLLTSSKLYLFIQETHSEGFILMDSCTVQDITQICVDNQDRTYCALLIDDSIDNHLNIDKRTWIIKFHSEFELGKFEQKLFAAWHLLYQVPIQFVLLADNDLKTTIRRKLAAKSSETILPSDEMGISVANLASL